MNNLNNRFIFGLFLFCALFIQKCDSAVSLTTSSTTYSQNIGDSVTLTCRGLEMNLIDVIWQYTDSGGSSTTIYSDLTLAIASGKYGVSNTQHAFADISSALTINNVNSDDASYTYECVCNTLRICSGGNTASASMVLIALGKYSPFFLN